MAAPKDNQNARRTSGVRVSRSGYLQITCGPMRGKYVHRLIGQAKIGRELTDDEEAHHIDHDPTNCDPSNIEVVSKSWNRTEGAIWKQYNGKARGGE